MLIVNGAGILPKYQRLGGNALLYYELERTISSKGGGKKFIHADLTQIAETTELMLSDLKNLGAEPYKVHRMYVRDI
jgi:CRISPR/Cas system-associated protein Csx1